MEPNEEATGGDATVHVSVVLDRSGSMNAIADDVVGGFNQFLAEQRRQPGTVRVTLAQFDSGDPFEVLIDSVDLREVTDLNRSAYQPRGMTPLYDAVGRMVAKIDAGIALRSELGTPAEDQVVVIITDGLENASREQTRDSVFELISERRKDGWVFVFLGANQDVYQEGHRIAVAKGNLAAWDKTRYGTKKMWQDLAYSTSEHLSKSRYRRRAEADEFFKEDPDGQK